MKFLFRQHDIAALVFLRVVFGVLGFADVLATLIYKHYYLGILEPDGFQFKYYGFEWVQPFPEPLMSIFLFAVLFSAIGIVLGKWYRQCSLFFALGFTYIFLWEKGVYLNHGYLFCVLSFIMCLLPVHRAYSMDVLANPKLQIKTIPYWTLFLPVVMMSIVYFFGGIAKINSDWLAGYPLKIWLRSNGDMPILGWLWKQEWVAMFMSYGGMLLDLSIVFLMLNKRTRVLGLLLVIFFHVVNLILFKIGIFPYLSLGLTLLFFPSDFPRKIYRWFIRQRDRFLPQAKNWKNSITNKWQQLQHLYNQSDSVISYTAPKKQFISASIAVFILANCLIPLRHHLYEGNCAWTEEGHRYSWRMMLRSKRGSGHFEVVDPKTKKVLHKVKPTDEIEKFRAHKVYVYPDMVLQFAHYLEEKYKTEAVPDPEVYAYVRVKLNQHHRQPFIDPKVDLTKVEWSIIEASDWILPFTPSDQKSK